MPLYSIYFRRLFSLIKYQSKFETVTTKCVSVTVTDNFNDKRVEIM